MKKYFLFSVLLILCLGLFSCQNENKTIADDNSEEIAEEAHIISRSREVQPIQRKPQRTIEKDGISVPYYSYEAFTSFLEAKNDTTYVINFWATWCGPCVAELPDFEKLYEQYKGEKVRLILVSLDFDKQLESKLIPFLKEKNLQGEVLVLSQNGVNEWIDKIDSTWSGSIPATLIYNQDKRGFYEQVFHFEELEATLKEYI